MQKIEENFETTFIGVHNWHAHSFKHLKNNVQVLKQHDMSCLLTQTQTQTQAG